MLTIPENTTKEILRECVLLFDNGNNWIKGYMSLDKEGNTVLPTDKKAVKFCSIGMIIHVATKFNVPDRDPVLALMYSEVELFHESHIAVFNDDPKTTFPMIEQAFQFAETKLEEMRMRISS